jgi:hypothetical protein
MKPLSFALALVAMAAVAPAVSAQALPPSGYSSSYGDTSTSTRRVASGYTDAGVTDTV